MHFINEFSSSNDLSEDDIENIKYHAENGNADAQYHLGLMHDSGKSIERNPREAEKWYKQSAAQGHAGALYYLSRLYSTQNSGIRKDEKEAGRLLKKAAEKGHP